MPDNNFFTEQRRQTRKIFYDQVPVGGGTPVTVQSMTNTNTANIAATVEQIKTLQKAGCEIIRVAVPDQESATALATIKSEIKIPLIADIHFDYRLALEAIKQGIDGLRINPGNIGDKSRVSRVVQRAKKENIPIRVGVNAGSLSREILAEFGQPSAEAMVASALNHIKILENNEFKDIIISLKASKIGTTVRAHMLLASEVDYPFHIGITEAGGGLKGNIKSAAGLGALLSYGFGDTLRVSLTGDPVDEVKAGREILKSLGLRNDGPRIVSCPTCGRTKVDLVALVKEVEQLLADVELPITVAVMGCAVNGPGEAREADIGIAFGENKGLLFKEGKKMRKVSEDELIDNLKAEINKLRGAE